MPKAEIVLQKDYVVGLCKLLWRQSRLWHTVHEWILISQSACLLPIKVSDGAGKIPWKTLCDAFGSAKHLLETRTLPVSWQTSINLFQRSLKYGCLASRFVILFAECAQEIYLAVCIVIVTAITEDKDEAGGVRYTVWALDIPRLDAILITFRLVAIFVDHFRLLRCTSIKR